MNISLASAQGSGKANEDWVGATRSCAIVLDGITSVSYTHLTLPTILRV